MDERINKSLDERVDQGLDECQVVEERIKLYLASLTKKEYQAYLIAKDHLRDSFDIEKGNGFLKWVKKNYS